MNEYAINDREPSISEIKALLAELQTNIVEYKNQRDSRYNISAVNREIAADSANNVLIDINDSSNYNCNQFCHGQNSKSWQNKLPYDWLGAQCLYSIQSGTQYGCDFVNSSQTPVPQPPPPQQRQTPPPPTQRLAPTATSQVESRTQRKYNQRKNREYFTGRCMCQRNDSFLFSSASTGDSILPPTPLYTFSTGENKLHHGTSCGNDQTATTISIQCLNDLWANAGCTTNYIPTNTANSVYKLPGYPQYTFPVKNGKIDTSDIPNMTLGFIKKDLPNIIAKNPNLCKANPSLDAMRDTILIKINRLNDLINKILPIAVDNKAQADSSVLKILNEFNQMNTEFNELVEDLKKPSELDANYEISRIKTASNFSKYLLFFILMLLVIGCLVYIFKNPEAGNLDMFILGLAIIIFVYYIYQYIMQKGRQTNM